MTAHSSAAKEIDVKSGSGQLHDQDWTFGISEFDPSNPFLDDSALLGGLTPDWCGDFLDHSQFPLPIDRRDHSLTSHEASSDEEHGIGFSAKPQADISNNVFNSRDWSRTTSYVAEESARPRYGASTHMEQQPANNSDKTTVWHHVRNRPASPGTSSTGHYNLDHDEEEEDDGACSVASDSSLVKFTSRSSSNTRSRSRPAGTGSSAQNTRSSNSSTDHSYHNSAVSNNGVDIESSTHISGGGGGGMGGGGRGSATGRKKATEQARTVLMDWLHENKGKRRRL